MNTDNLIVTATKVDTVVIRFAVLGNNYTKYNDLECRTFKWY